MSTAGQMTEEEFAKATGLYEKARSKFEGLGMITPQYRELERFYSEEDVQLVITVMSLLDGKVNLITAYKKAIRFLNQQAA
jgi:hypothetical protein